MTSLKTGDPKVARDGVKGPAPSLPPRRAGVRVPLWRHFAHYVFPNHWKAALFPGAWHRFVEENDRAWNQSRYDPAQGQAPAQYDDDHGQSEAHLTDLNTYEGQCWDLWDEFRRRPAPAEREWGPRGSIGLTGAGAFCRMFNL